MTVEARAPTDPNIPPEQPAGKDQRGRESYLQILKSSAWIGGSSAIVVLIGIVRTKAMAIFLGPAGFGLMGLFSSLADIVVAIAGMGINASGVRQIADAAKTGEASRIARTATVLLWTSLALGLIGAITLIVLSAPASVLTFGTDQYATAVALLSLVVLFRLIAAGQGALLQGMRRIADLSKIGVIGSLLGTLVAIPLVYVFREDGVVPSLVGMAAISIATSWWYTRKVPIETAKLRTDEIGSEAAALLKLGLAFMASAMLMMGSAYAVRAIVLREAGLEAAGFYSAAWTLGGLYVGFILQAMGSDFYPRLVGVAQDNAACNRLVNEQAQVSMLLAGPGVIATLAFAPWVVKLFYTAEFEGAVEILRWICLGMALRVITWPMGFIIVAKNRQLVFFGAEVAWTVVNLGLAWLLIGKYGANGAGMAFFGSYVFHGLMIYPLARRLSGFRWSSENRKIGLLFLTSIAAAFGGSLLLPPLWGMVSSCIILLASTSYGLHAMMHLVPIERAPGPVQRLLMRLGAVRNATKIA